MSSFSPPEKLAILGEVTSGKSSVYSVCKKYRISKVAFYKWLKQYKSTKKNRLGALASQIRSGKKHPRSLSYSRQLAILRMVHKNPLYSCRTISKILNIGHHGVQNFLERNSLNQRSLREEFSKTPFWKRQAPERRMAMIEQYRQGWKV